MTERCKVCAAQVRSADDGVVFRLGERTLALCAEHTRIAQNVARAGALVFGKAALAGLDARYPEAMETARRSAALTESIGSALRRAYDEREVLGLEPVEVAQRRPMRVSVSKPQPQRPRRRTRREASEIIDAEIIEEVKL